MAARKSRRSTKQTEQAPLSSLQPALQCHKRCQSQLNLPIAYPILESCLPRVAGIHIHRSNSRTLRCMCCSRLWCRQTAGRQEVTGRASRNMEYATSNGTEPPIVTVLVKPQKPVFRYGEPTRTFVPPSGMSARPYDSGLTRDSPSPRFGQMWACRKGWATSSCRTLQTRLRQFMQMNSTLRLSR